MGCGDIRAHRHRRHDHRAGGALLHQRWTEGRPGSNPLCQRHPERLPDTISFAFAQREADQEPDSVSGQDSDSFARREPEPITGCDTVRGYETDSVTDREPDPVGDRFPLDGHLPEQPVSVGLDDVGHRHSHIPVGCAVGAHAHLDHV